MAFTSSALGRAVLGRFALGGLGSSGPAPVTFPILGAYSQTTLESPICWSGPGLAMYRDNTGPIAAQFLFQGAPIDLTGCALWFTAKYRQGWQAASDASAFLQFSTGAGTVLVTSPATLGQATATITPAMTAVLAGPAVFTYDWKLVDSYGNVTTTELSTLVVTPDVTRSGDP